MSKVIDGSTILLNDGKIIRLLGMDYPYVRGSSVSEQSLAAKDRLEKLLPAGTDVNIWQSRNAKTGRTNRMGHILAHLETKKEDRWINGTLVREGLAFVQTDWNNPDMAQSLYKLEDGARQDALNIWAKGSAYGLLNPENAQNGDGAFRVVEGTIKRAATSKNNLYLNFGEDRNKDFTVMVSSGLRKDLSKRGIDPMNLSGQKVRVRGWIRIWNGPFMELESAERLEILSTHKPTDLSAPLPTEPSTTPDITGQPNP